MEQQFHLIQTQSHFLCLLNAHCQPSFFGSLNTLLHHRLQTASGPIHPPHPTPTPPHTNTHRQTHIVWHFWWWPSHCSRLSLRWTSTGTSVSMKMFSFLIICLKDSSTHTHLPTTEVHTHVGLFQISFHLQSTRLVTSYTAVDKDLQVEKSCDAS